MRAGKMGSFLSWAVSTRILRGPLGQSTASRSEESTEETIQTGFKGLLRPGQQVQLFI